MSKEQCGDCRFFELMDENDLSDKDGWCKRYPPVRIDFTEYTDENGAGDSMCWSQPVTHANFWCVEFKPLIW